MRLRYLYRTLYPTVTKTLTGQFGENLPAECPECGAIRKVVEMSFQQSIFPEHSPLQGTARERKRWKKVNNKWIVVG